MKEDQKEHNKKREELLKWWGGKKVEYVSVQDVFIDRMMKDFTSDLKRMNNLFEDDADDMEVGGELSADGGTGEEDVLTPILISTALPITYASRTSRMHPSPFDSS